MRVVAGKIRGNRLKVPQGRLIRPTTSMVKQAIFSILESIATSQHRVLDLYAGTGALGIEALSHGAEWVDFVERRKKCCDIIKYNLENTGGASKAHIYCCDVNKAISFLDNSYDVIFIDPPYSDGSIANLLIKLSNSKLIRAGSIVVVCHSKHSPLGTAYDRLHLVRQHHYGDTFLSIYQEEFKL
jgi:16S rRNA (guanine(966)-N(2))-methyltransferase RsmD